VAGEPERGTGDRRDQGRRGGDRSIEDHRVEDRRAGNRPGGRRWPRRAWSRLTAPFVAALVTGVADPPSRRAGWRQPEALQHLRHYLPVSHIDIVVIGEILTALAIFAGTNSALVAANDRAGTAVANGELLILAAAGASLPLLLRDLWPLAAWRLSLPSLVLTVSVTKQVYTYPGAPENPYPAGAVLMYLLVLYSVGVRCERRVSVGAWLISVGGMWILHPDPSLFLGAIMTAAALLYGYNVRVRRQAQRQVVEEERRTEDERAARAVLEERSRIARELHDVVAHHMSVIAIQAEAAPIKAPDDPAALRAELAEVRATALAALVELRRTLGLLRHGDELPTTAPQPGLDDLDELLATSRAAGAVVTMTTSGRPRRVPPGLGLVAYRVLQESLSNALRHAPGAPVRVHLDYRERELRLRVENDPPPRGRVAAPRDRGGHGLTGMRERVGAVDGTLTTGPTPAGGFAVSAVLPVEPTATAGVVGDPDDPGGRPS
jgi:signal transduction histidine kinase